MMVPFPNCMRGADIDARAALPNDRPAGRYDRASKSGWQFAGLPPGLTQSPRGGVRERASGKGVPMGADALSDVLRAVRLTGAVFFHNDLMGEWVSEPPP